MTSAKKITANRSNSRKSTGPRTSGGKTSASRNALRHGLATIALPEPEVSSRIKRIAKKIVGDNADSAQYEQAVIIAESAIMLLNVRAAAVAAIEHHRGAGPTETNSADKDQSNLEAISGGRRPDNSWDDLAAMRLALPELIKLERYEGRAKSRRRRAIRRLMELKAGAFYCSQR
jgi:hypothetical protein